jgi:hypothetical protein
LWWLFLGGAYFRVVLIFLISPFRVVLIFEGGAYFRGGLFSKKYGIYVLSYKNPK